MTRLARHQFALLKAIESHGNNGAERSESIAIARMKKAIGTTTRFASSEMGATR